MKRIIAALTDKVEKLKLDRKVNRVYRSIETVSKDVKDIHTTTDKITKRFNSINQVEIKEIGDVG